MVGLDTGAAPGSVGRGGEGGVVDDAGRWEDPKARRQQEGWEETLIQSAEDQPLA